MQLSFSKYQGTGNDFIIIDNRKKEYRLSKEDVAKLCHRRFGIGADGLMLLETEPGYDFKMVYYNSDGGESTMCGNGGRCLVKYASGKGILKNTYRFLAIDGAHEASIDLDGTVSLKMTDVKQIQRTGNHYELDTGSPHWVEMVDDVDSLDVAAQGRERRQRPPHTTNGINVNFVQQGTELFRIKVRTYERGVEAETLSCGTGVTAAAIVCNHNENGFNRVEVTTPGGRLIVEYDKVGDVYQNVWLTGPAQEVFTGTIIT